MYHRVEKVKDQLIGIRPVYKEGANATELLLNDGNILVDKRNLKSVRQALGKAYEIDIAAQQRNLQELLERKHLLPFCLGPERVFVLFKMRRAVSRNDSIYGYIDVLYIMDIITDVQGKCRILLTNGLDIPVVSSRNTAEQSRSLGEKLLRIKESEQGKSDEVLIMDSIRTIVGCLLRWHHVNDINRENEQERQLQVRERY